jgi:hypothetical protein
LAQTRYRRAAAILLCALVSGPLILALNIGKLALEDYPKFPDFGGWAVSEALLGVAKIDVASLPVLVVYSLVMHGLARLRKDTFVFATVMGAAIVYLGVAAFALVLLGEMPGHRELSDAVLSLALGAVLGAFYWAMCIRKERAQRKAREIEQALIRTME